MLGRLACVVLAFYGFLWVLTHFGGRCQCYLYNRIYRQGGTSPLTDGHQVAADRDLVPLLYMIGEVNKG